MKALLIIVVLLVECSLAYTQSYDCFVPGNKQYFTNEDGYLRGIRIDSVRQQGDTTFYFPFHTLRGLFQTYNANLDSTGGSWVGKKVMKLASGKYLFDNYYSDSVVLMPNASTNSEWIFYRDLGSVYYKARIIATDTGSVLGNLDSIKTIVITAWDSTTPVHSSPWDSFQIQLSKTNGFVQLFDLYMFPLHSFGQAISTYNDFYTGKIHQYNSSVGRYVDQFTAVDLVNPTEQQLYTWQSGSTFEYETCTAFAQTIPCPFYIYKVFPSANTINYTGFLIDTSRMPEEGQNNNLVWYKPNDTSYCTLAPAYEIDPSFLTFQGQGNAFEGPIVYNRFKYGLGQTYYYWEIGEGNGYSVNYFKLDWYNLNSYGGQFICGNYHPLSIENQTAKNNVLQVYPNPFYGQLNLKLAEVTTLVNVYNSIGEVIYSSASTSMEQHIQTEYWPTGIYFICIQTNDGHKEYKKVVKY